MKGSKIEVSAERCLERPDQWLGIVRENGQVVHTVVRRTKIGALTAAKNREARFANNLQKMAKNP